jgi:hypothetical protein
MKYFSAQLSSLLSCNVNKLQASREVNATQQQQLNMRSVRRNNKRTKPKLVDPENKQTAVLSKTHTVIASAEGKTLLGTR